MAARKARKGDRIKYVGPYRPEVAEENQYPPGKVVGFREHGQVVTVLLDGAGDRYADWPIDEVEQLPAPQCRAADRFGNRCVRPEHADDKRWPGHVFPKTADQARVEADDALADMAKFLGIGE